MKKFLSIALALVMALSLCVTTAWADGETVNELWQSNIDNGTYWQSGYPYHLEGGSYKLMENIKLDGALFVDNDSTGGVTIDLNGYTLSLKSGVQNNVLYVNSVTLTLEDSSAAKTGKITGGTGDDNGEDYVGGGVWVGSSGTFEMYGGTITGCTADLGGGVFVGSGGSFDMYGGTISGNSASKGGGGVYVGSSGNFILYDGTIKDNTCTNGSAVYNAGTIKAESGTISGTIEGTADSTSTVVGGEFIVTFDAVGGSPEPDSQHLFGDGHKATKPADPTREGFKFLYWYDGNGDDTVYYNFDDIVTYNRYLKAKWEEIPSDPVVDPVEEPTVSGGHTPIRRQNTTAVTTDTTPADTATKTDTVTSAKTFDVGVAVYGVLAVTSLLGMGYVGKKR